MCGILGYISEREQNIGEILLQGLKRLTYRGYDSFGFAFKTDSKIEVLKDVGDVEKLKELNFVGHVGIAHVRWATHGGVSKANAHPHLSCDGSVAIVHNGIIENYEELRKFLERNGHRFTSETDSEVVAHLIEEGLKEGKSPVVATRYAFKKLEGSFALAVLFRDYDLLVGARRDSPLIVGLGNGEVFLSSDVIAFINHTRKAIYLEDDEMVVVRCE